MRKRPAELVVMPFEPMRATRILRFAALIATLLVVSMAVYYSLVIYSARQYTVGTVLPNSRNTDYALSFSDLSPHQLEILLKAEDPRFFQHGGVDFSTPGAGITTITQALVKRLFFDKFTPGIAKLKQTAIAAYALDPLMPKQEQLRLFINTSYLGHNVRGFEQAAQVYFHKPFKQLSEEEYIAIVAMLIAPEVFSVQKFPARNAERVARIKGVVSGEYKPRGLFDVYYGKIDIEVQKNLPPLSYFESYYQ
jgi:membrane peptidoglycan carboxypeptidase